MSRNHPKDSTRTIRDVYGRLPRNPVRPVNTLQDAALWTRMEGPLTPVSVPMPASGTTCRQLNADAAAFARAGRKGQAPVFLFVFSGFGMRVPLDGLTPMRVVQPSSSIAARTDGASVLAAGTVGLRALYPDRPAVASKCRPG